jgi:ATP-binding cassette subfamily B protein
LKSLRGNIGIVQQDVYLFSGTIYENISYGRPGASKEDVIEAAKRAGAHGFIMGLKDGYDTYVGERGVKLSGGQKQRISIARVFLKNPPIIILMRLLPHWIMIRKPPSWNPSTDCTAVRH